MRLDGGGEPDAAADDAVVADDRFAAEDGRVGIDHHTVFNRRMPLVASDQIAVVIGGKAEGPQRHALINLDVIADFACLADHHAGAVVDEEVIADGRPRMNVDAGLLVGPFANHAGNERHPQTAQLVSNAVAGNRLQPRIAEHHFIHAAASGVAVKGGLGVVGQRLPQAGNAL